MKLYYGYFRNEAGVYIVTARKSNIIEIIKQEIKYHAVLIEINEVK